MNILLNLCYITLLFYFKDEDESRFNSYSVQMLKCCPSKSQTQEHAGEIDVANNLIYELLNALIAKPVEVPEESNLFFIYLL